MILGMGLRKFYKRENNIRRNEQPPLTYSSYAKGQWGYCSQIVPKHHDGNIVSVTFGCKGGAFINFGAGFGRNMSEDVANFQYSCYLCENVVEILYFCGL